MKLEGIPHNLATTASFYTQKTTFSHQSMIKERVIEKLIIENLSSKIVIKTINTIRSKTIIRSIAIVFLLTATQQAQ